MCVSCVKIVLRFDPSEFIQVLIIPARYHLVQSHKNKVFLCDPGPPILSGLSGDFPLPANLSQSDTYWPASLMACLPPIERERPGVILHFYS